MSIQAPLLSVIIPAFNEEGRVNSVINSIKSHEYINEVIVVDDNSSDNTFAEIAKREDVIVLKHSSNKGKAEAIRTGLKKATSDFVLLLDADIPNITDQNIEDLLDPVITGEFDITIALIGDRFQRMIKFDFLSGIRAMSRKHLSDFFTNYEPDGYELETLMNKYIIENDLTFAYVDWRNSYFIYSSTKYGKYHGFTSIIKKRLSALRSVGVFKYYLLTLKMIRRRIWIQRRRI